MSRPPVPATPEQLARHAAVVLIAIGLDQQPGDPWGVAHDIAEALGLLPDEPVNRPPRQASGWARQKAREARKAAQT